MSIQHGPRHFIIIQMNLAPVAGQEGSMDSMHSPLQLQGNSLISFTPVTDDRTEAVTPGVELIVLFSEPGFTL